MDRRLFVVDSAAALAAAALAACGGGGGRDGGVTGPPIGYIPPAPGTMTPGVTTSGSTIVIDLAAQTSLTNSGGFLLIPEARTFVIHIGNSDDFRAFTSVCTHEGCDVDNFSGSRIRCPCHGSQYDSNGAVVIGPAPRALRRFAASRSGNTLTITKS